MKISEFIKKNDFHPFYKYLDYFEDHDFCRYYDGVFPKIVWNYDNVDNYKNQAEIWSIIASDLQEYVDMRGQELDYFHKEYHHGYCGDGSKYSISR